MNEFKKIGFALVGSCFATVVAAQTVETSPGSRDQAFERYSALSNLADVCVTDPCPVSRTEINLGGQQVSAIVVRLPDREIFYIGGDVDSVERFGTLLSCEPANYVEISPNLECIGLN